MTRTRLDEIVEEILPNDPYTATHDFVRSCGLRIAERAFRHGVEQSNERLREMVETLRSSYRDSAPLGSVQPAPAEEKPWKHPYKPPVGVCQIPGCTDLPFEHPVDRRKGERRRPGNWPTNYVHFIRTDLNSLPIYQVSPHGAWYEDRRSGEDRRKS